jgi:hypothetical protein
MYLGISVSFLAGLSGLANVCGDGETLIGVRP